MARAKKTAVTKSASPSTAPKTRGIDLQEVEARVTALDKAKRRSYDIFDIEQRVYNLEKKGGGGGSITPGNTIPKYTASSTDQYAKGIETAFNFVTNTNFRAPDNAWSGSSSDSAPYIVIEYGYKCKVSEIELKCFSNYSAAYEGKVKIQGSDDGTTYTDITDLLDFNAPLQELGTKTLSVNASVGYKYIKLLFNKALSASYAPSCFFDQINIIGVSS